MAITKTRKAKGNKRSIKSNGKGSSKGHLRYAGVLDPREPYLPTGNVVWDIETAPLDPNEPSGALNAESGRVIAIGYFEPEKDRVVICADKDESAMLQQLWRVFCSVHGHGVKMIGFNTSGFDIPFTVRRSWHNGVMVPSQFWGWGGKPCATMVDIMDKWKCGAWKEFISLDRLLRFLGVGEKTGKGEEFYKLLQNDKKAAFKYLASDVRRPWDAAQKMGVA